MTVAPLTLRTGANVFAALSAIVFVAALTLRFGFPTMLGELSTTPQRAAYRVSLPIHPAVPLTLYRPISRDEALEINAAIAADDPGPAARPFVIGNGAYYDRAVTCLATAVYYEAASEDDAGQKAVAQVVLNRVRHPAFPNSVCAVVYQGSERTTGCQFTFTCDGSLKRTPSAWGLARARRIAAAALAGAVYRPVGMATHYHANWVVPYWASSLTKSITVGAHLFYRWKGGWGLPLAFRQKYAAFEPDMTVGLASVEPDPPNATVPVDLASLAIPADGPAGGRGAILAADAVRLKIDDAAKPLAADLQRGSLRPELTVKQRLLADTPAEAIALATSRDAMGRAPSVQAR